MSCRKKAFDTKQSALDWLRSHAYPNRRTAQTPTRVYPCDKHQAPTWHLTSKPLGKRQTHG